MRHLTGFVIFTFVICGALANPVLYGADRYETEVGKPLSFLTCMVKCVGKSLAQVEQWNSECHTSAKCWAKKIGLKGLKCAGQCILSDAIVEEKDIDLDALFDSVDEPQNFLSCLAKCLGKSLADVKTWYSECGKSAKCWIGKVGLRGLKCTGECITLDAMVCGRGSEDEFKGLIDNGDVLVDGPMSFVFCMAKCLGKSATQIAQWHQECGKSAGCWTKHVGLTAVKCLGKCVLGDEERIEPVIEDTTFMKQEVDKPLSFLTCMVKCVGKSLTQVEQWYSECHTNAKCWAKKVGLTGLKCAGQCILLDAVMEGNELDFEVLLDAVDEPQNFLSCLAKCLGKSLAEVEEWYSECGKSAKCWVGKVGLRGLKCTGECITLDAMVCDRGIEDEFNNLADNGDVLVDGPVSFVFCMAKCLGKSATQIAQWHQECGKSAGCWTKHVGLAAVKCLGKCVLDDEKRNDHEPVIIEDTTFMKQEVKKPSSFLTCMVKCVGKSLTQVRKWYSECHTNAKCWGKKVGLKGLECAGKYILLDVTEGNEVDFEVLLDAVDEPQNFLSCLAKCLGKSLAEVEEWYSECGKSAKCWVGKVGLRGLKCTGECITLDAMVCGRANEDEIRELAENGEIMVDGPVSFVLCMAKCASKSATQIAQWHQECGKSAGCWIKYVGLAGVKCLGKCILASNENPAVNVLPLN